MTHALPQRSYLESLAIKVVTLAVYVYFAVSLVGEQWTESEKVNPIALTIDLHTITLSFSSSHSLSIFFPA